MFFFFFFFFHWVMNQICYLSYDSLTIPIFGHIKCWGQHETIGTFMYSWRQNIATALKKLSIHLQHDPDVLLLGIYSREIKAYVHTKLL